MPQSAAAEQMRIQSDQLQFFLAPMQPLPSTEQTSLRLTLSLWIRQWKTFFILLLITWYIIYQKGFLPITHKLGTYCTFGERDCCQQIHFWIAIVCVFPPLELLLSSEQFQSGAEKSEIVIEMIISLYITV